MEPIAVSYVSPLIPRPLPLETQEGRIVAQALDTIFLRQGHICEILLQPFEKLAWDAGYHPAFIWRGFSELVEKKMLRIESMKLWPDNWQPERFRPTEITTE